MNALFFIGSMCVSLAMVWVIYLLVRTMVASDTLHKYSLLIARVASILIVVTGSIGVFVTGGPRVSLHTELPGPPEQQEIKSSPDFIPEIDRKGMFDQPSSLEKE